MQLFKESSKTDYCHHYYYRPTATATTTNTINITILLLLLKFLFQQLFFLQITPGPPRIPKEEPLRIDDAIFLPTDALTVTQPTVSKH